MIPRYDGDILPLPDEYYLTEQALRNCKNSDERPALQIHLAMVYNDHCTRAQEIVDDRIIELEDIFETSRKEINSLRRQMQRPHIKAALKVSEWTTIIKNNIILLAVALKVKAVQAFIFLKVRCQHCHQYVKDNMNYARIGMLSLVIFSTIYALHFLPKCEKMFCLNVDHDMR